MDDIENKDKNRKESSGFKVEDKRLFNADGSPITEHHDSPKAESSEPSQQETVEDERNASDTKSESQPGIDFASFVFSLATSAMANLGEVPDPTTGEISENLEAAKQMIDILTMLQEKTKGNLEADEENILENLLYELRMKYLAKTKIISL